MSFHGGSRWLAAPSDGSCTDAGIIILQSTMAIGNSWSTGILMGHSYIYIQYLFIHINCLCSIAMFDFKRVPWIFWDQCHSVMFYSDNVVGSNSPWNSLHQIWHQPTNVGISPCSNPDAVWSIPSSPCPRAFGSQPRPNSRGLFKTGRHRPDGVWLVLVLQARPERPELIPSSQRFVLCKRRQRKPGIVFFCTPWNGGWLWH